MEVFRISKCNYITDLSGRGASTFPGRWNNKGTYVLYTAATPSLALLESVVHISIIPSEGFCMITLNIPDKCFHEVSMESLPEHWSLCPTPDALKSIGDKFVKEGKYLALKLPSAIMPEEFNFLINPLHPDFTQVKITAQRSLVIDERLIKR